LSVERVFDGRGRQQLRVVLLLLAVALPARAADFAWSSDATSEYLLKAGSDRMPVFGARVEGRLSLGGWLIGARLQASAKPGTGEAGQVQVTQPGSYETLEGYISLGYAIRDWVAVTCVGGLMQSVNALQEQMPGTLACGPRFSWRGGYVYTLYGLHRSAGDGGRFLVSARIPVGLKRTAAIGNAVVGGGGRSFALVGVSYALSEAQ
jgi:hypothetical protein